MSQQIKIKFDKKKIIGASAKPGEITFGTHTHLLHLASPNPVEVRLRKAELALKNMPSLEGGVPKNMSIKTLLIGFNRLKAMQEFFFAQRMVFLTNYKKLKQRERETLDDIKSVEYKKRAREAYRQVMRIETILKKSIITEEEYTRHLTLALKNEPKKKVKKAPAPAAKIELTEQEREEANELLDARNRYNNRRQKILNELRQARGSIPATNALLMELSETDQSLSHIDFILKGFSAPKKNTSKTTKSKG